MKPYYVTHLWTADFEKVDGLPADEDVTGYVTEEDRCTVLNLFCSQGIAVGPVVLVCRKTSLYLITDPAVCELVLNALVSTILATGTYHG